MMQPPSPRSAAAPPNVVGQLQFWHVDDHAWEEWILSRLSRGDRITVSRYGDIVISDGD